MKKTFKYLLELLKQSIIILIYTVILGMTSLLALMIPENLSYLKVMALILILLLYFFVTFILCKSTAETQYKCKINGDLRRKHGENNEDMKYLTPEKEYRKLNGFLIGVCSLLPMYILLIIGWFIPGIDGTDTAVALIFSIFSSLLKTISISANMNYMFVMGLITWTSCGLGYLFGGKKIEFQQKKLEEKERDIYGR